MTHTLAATLHSGYGLFIDIYNTGINVQMRTLRYYTFMMVYKIVQDPNLGGRRKTVVFVGHRGSTHARAGRLPTRVLLKFPPGNRITREVCRRISAR